MDPKTNPDRESAVLDTVTESPREEVLLKTGALQNAIFNSANFSSIATDEKGVIQIFNVGVERWGRGYPIPRGVAFRRRAYCH